MLLYRKKLYLSVLAVPTLLSFASLNFGAATLPRTLTLEEILSEMDKRGKTLRAMSSTLVQKRWTDILEEFDQGEEGHFFFLREKAEVYIRKDIVKPQRNTLVVRQGEVLFYQPKIKQMQRYTLGGKRDRAEFLLLGFGSRQESLKNAYNIRLLKKERLAERDAYLLELVPKSEEVSAYFSKIVLWIDPSLWVPIQQKLVEPTRDFLLIQFEDIRLNPKISRSRFNLKLPKDVRVVGQ